MIINLENVRWFTKDPGHKRPEVHILIAWELRVISLGAASTGAVQWGIGHNSG